MEMRESDCGVSQSTMGQDRQEMEVMEVRWIIMEAVVVQEQTPKILEEKAVNLEMWNQGKKRVQVDSRFIF